MYKVGIIWTGIVNNIEANGIDEVKDVETILHQNVKIKEIGSIISNIEAEGVDIIVGTAGAENEIYKYATVPVSISYTSYIDILETILLIEKKYKITDKKIALVLYKTNSIQINRIRAFTDNQIDLYKFNDPNHLKQIIDMISEKKYDIVIGGPSPVNLAESMGIESYMLIYDKQSILQSIEKARDILNYIQRERIQIQRFKTTISMIPEGIISTDSKGHVTFCNHKVYEMMGLKESDVYDKKIDDIMEDFSWNDVYEKGIKQLDVPYEYKNKSFFLTRQPIIENGQAIGSVGILQEAERIQNLERKYRLFQSLGLTAKNKFEDIVGTSPIMKQVIELAKIYAKSELNILIEGETGTGKEIFAQSIHNESTRKNGPFVAINCATLPESLLESELMGYEEGAFTGAKRGGKMGLFERAHKGSIFLDEINQIPFHLQSKLLRVIQEKEVLRLGGEKIIPVDVRIITATNEDIIEKIKNGTFRNDLYYRINVLNLKLPPLRKRKEDIQDLIEHFIANFLDSNLDKVSIPQKLYKFILDYNWPGNIRELQNFVERHAILSKSIGDVTDLHMYQDFTINENNIKSEPQNPDIIKVRINTLDNMTSQLISEVVNRCDGNKTRAALLLDISRVTINNKIKS